MTERKSRAQQRKNRTQAIQFGHRIERYRQKRFLTLQALADRIVALGADAGFELTLTPSAISGWIAGDYEPALRYRPFIAQALDADPHDLFEPVPSYGAVAS